MKQPALVDLRSAYLSLVLTIFFVVFLVSQHFQHDESLA